MRVRLDKIHNSCSLYNDISHIAVVYWSQSARICVHPKRPSLKIITWNNLNLLKAESYKQLSTKL